MELQPIHPTPADYKALLDRATALMQSRDAGHIDARAFRQRIAEITDQTRTLDLLCKLHRTCARLAALGKKPQHRP